MSIDIKTKINTINWSKIEAVILDCDGVLTDGKIDIDDEGRHSRRFDMRDGLGLVRLRESGVKVAIISSASYTSIVHRAKSLGIEDVYIGVRDKTESLKSLAESWGICSQNIAFIGDDLVDIPVMQAVGYPIALNDAVKEVLDIVCYIASKNGGDGGVREICDLIINSRNNNL